MIQVQGIGQEAHQRHTILFEESEVIIDIRFYATIQMWVADMFYKDFVVRGQKLSLGTTHILELNQPFDFAVTDESQEGIDPFRLNDFSDDRCRLYMLEADDVADLRGGVRVQI